VPIDQAGVLLYVVNHDRLRTLRWPSKLWAYDTNHSRLPTRGLIDRSARSSRTGPESAVHLDAIVAVD
jgi:hypothetical protein